MPCCNDILVLLRNATIASSAMLTAQRPAQETHCAECAIIEGLAFDQLIDQHFLLRSALDLLDPPGILDHALEVEVGTRAVQDDEQCIHQNVALVRPYIHGQSCPDNDLTHVA